MPNLNKIESNPNQERVELSMDDINSEYDEIVKKIWYWKVIKWENENSITINQDSKEIWIQKNSSTEHSSYSLKREGDKDVLTTKSWPSRKETEKWEVWEEEIPPKIHDVIEITNPSDIKWVLNNFLNRINQAEQQESSIKRERIQSANDFASVQNSQKADEYLERELEGMA